MFIVIIGPPGVGKGTQCRRLSDALQIPHVSTGEMLREVRAALPDDHPMTSIDDGNLVSDQIVTDLMSRRTQLPDCQSGCLFDGFPRTATQAAALDELLDDRGKRVALAVRLDAEMEELERRMLRRATEENRADDTCEALVRRMEVYRTVTLPVADYYEERGLLRTVDAMGPAEDVYRTLWEVIHEPL